MKKWIAALVMLLVLTGCGYRLSRGMQEGRIVPLAIPYVVGDEDGRLSFEVVRAVSQMPQYRYTPDGGELVLVVELLDGREENVGFRYDRKKDGKRKKEIVPTETRLFMRAQVSLVEAATGHCLLGPTSIQEAVDYDHFYYGHHEVNVFSLGQLTDREAAKEAASVPLNQRLAQQIVDWLETSSLHGL